MERSVKVVLALLLILTITSCSLIGSRTNQNQNLNPYAKYYTGKDGVVISYQSVPTKLYYYGPQDSAANKFVVGVNVDNKGASFSRGGIYLSGYNPEMIQFEEIPLKNGKMGACGISFGSIGYGFTGLIARCADAEFSTGGGITNVRVDDMIGLLQQITGRHTTAKWLDPEKFKYSLQVNDGPQGTVYTINMNQMNLMVDYYQHGRLLIAWLAGVDFRKNYGQEFLLAGDTYEFPGCESAYMEYNGIVTNWPAGLDLTTQHLMLTSCYMYTTYADPIVCIDPDPETDVRKVCTPKSKTWSGGNGAPVSLTSVEQENTPRKIIFRLNVKNIGVGTVYDPGMLEKCSPYYDGRVTPQDLNVVYLGDVRVGDVGLKGSGAGTITCSPEVIRLDPTTKTGSTTCTYPLEYTNTKSAYEAPLTVELWYGYSETLTRDVQIKRIT